MTGRLTRYSHGETGRDRVGIYSESITRVPDRYGAIWRLLGAGSYAVVIGMAERKAKSEHTSLPVPFDQPVAVSSQCYTRL